MTTSDRPLIYTLLTREKPAETFRGSVVSDNGDHHEFNGKTFEYVLEIVANMLIKSPDSRLVFQRTEAPYPMSLPKEIENLLRTDFKSAVKMLTVPLQKIMISRPKEKVSTQLRSGYNTLADALGDKVYLRKKSTERGIEIESPDSGRWVVMTIHGMGMYCGALPIAAITDGWVLVKIEDILSLNLPRYYLPRGWNERCGWIKHNELASIYEAYKKDKENVAKN